MNLLMLAEVAKQAAGGNKAAKASLRELSEYYFQLAVKKHAESKGWKVHHATMPAFKLKDGSYRGSALAGWPDLYMTRGTHALAWELKSEKGAATAEQKAWLAALEETGVQTAIFRPRDSEEIIRRLR